ncbi:hypothetical protein PVK06_043343 [Gossypium arboreum]|uniref:Reverse transcriptase n=1 Tax=Gossypium arboreum TaxID=29729 RepID=A0ABR0MN90_GOSAR|nr:hypothetical protein PVK06_043343 [Gossypium arboreum]
MSMAANVSPLVNLWAKLFYTTWVFKVPHSRGIVEVIVHDKLENILHHEEMLWKQNSKCKWLNLGDLNTSYFHRRMVLRKNFNKITALCNTDGEWIFDPEVLKTKMVNFFQNFYGENPCPLGFLPPNAFPRLSTEDVDLLGRGVTNEEIRAALFDMATLKAPGSDGFQVAFFQNQWDNIMSLQIDSKVSSRRSLDKNKQVLWNGIPTQKFRPIRDDLVIFSITDLTYNGILKNFLSNFCELLGHKVNVRKTNVFFSMVLTSP